MGLEPDTPVPIEMFLAKHSVINAPLGVRYILPSYLSLLCSLLNVHPEVCIDHDQLPAPWLGLR